MSEQKQCRLCNEDFTVENDDIDFLDRVSPIYQGKKYKISSPDLCPICRSRNRQVFRNIRNLYKRKDDNGKTFFTHYGSTVPFPVYDSAKWWSDDWDATDYAQEYSSEKRFFEQFGELFSRVPSLGRLTLSVEDCDYTNGIANSKHCFLSFNVDNSENCYYVTDCMGSRSCVDCLAISDCEYCHECIRCTSCTDLKNSIRCSNCSESMFLTDCRNCTNCIGCVNITNKQYYVFNKKVDKNEYKKILKNLDDFDKREEFRKKYEEFQLRFPKKYYYGSNCEDCSGDHLHSSKNVKKTYFSQNCENCKHCYYLFDVKDSMDYEVYGDGANHIYNCIATGGGTSNNSFCIGCWNNSSNNLYCNFISGCKNCFGCIGLKHKEYCILNKQYTKEEYESIVPKIIEKMTDDSEWGEFFPFSMSPFAYNETIAHEHYPLSKEKIQEIGCTYKDPSDLVPTNLEVIYSSQIPNDTSQLTEEICSKVIKCEKTGRLYQIQKGEFAFYQAKNISIPRIHSELRHVLRSKKRGPYQLFHRQCMCEETGHDHKGRCLNEFETTYALDRPEKVYCEKCYQQIVM